MAGSEQAQALLARATELLEQQEQGQYDVDALYAAALAGTRVALAAAQPGAPALLLLDCAEYVHRALAVAEVPGQGRGLMATELIKAGQLVMAVRAEQIASAVSVQTAAATGREVAWGMRAPIL